MADPRLGRYQTDRYDTAINQQSGASPEQAQQWAQEDNTERYSTPSKPSGGEAKPRGVLDSIKALMGIERDPPAGKEPKGGDESTSRRLGSAVGATYLSAPNSQKVYAQAAQSQNPAAMLGLMAAQATIKSREKMIGKNINHNPNMWTEDGGVLDDMLDEAFSNAVAFTGLKPDEKMFADAYRSAVTTLQSSQDAEQNSRIPQGAA